MTRDFFDPTPEQQLIVLVETSTLRKAERLIESCSRPPTEKMWSFRQEYLCSECRSYHFGGDRVRGYMTAR
jgi:hypothetical protein